MRYLDVCAGISAATVAWRSLGWEAAAYSEIEPALRAILKHHYPDTPLHGDFTTIAGDEYGPVQLLVGGTPCQDFSIAGLRAGLAGDRGNLSLQFLLLAARIRPRWIVWENVPGVFSSLSHDAPDALPPQIDLDGDDGPEDGTEIVVEDEYEADESHALGRFLAGLQELGYGFAYRVLDAQFAGVPQRRRRVFVVGYFGDWRRAAAVLFERHSLSGHPAPRRKAGEGLAGTLKACAGKSGTPNGADAMEDLSPTLRAGGHSKSHANAGVMPAVAFNARQDPGHGPITDALGSRDTGHGAMIGSAVRRLTPRECERLQGFPDDYTLVSHRGKPMADGPRYKALGNSMAVPVMRWIGERIAAVEALDV